MHAFPFKQTHTFIRIWIDLRSQTEVDEDAEINGAIYKGENIYTHIYPRLHVCMHEGDDHV